MSVITTLLSTDSGALSLTEINTNFSNLNSGKLDLSGVSGGQTAIGGTGITDILKLQGTSGNGTLTSPAIQMLVGNNGATNALTVLNNGNVGINTTNPLQKLDITGGSFRLDNTTGTTPTGIIYKGTVPFISDFNYGSNGTVTTAGQNTFVGINAGNLSMGSTATLASQSSYNTAVGNGALHSNTTGYFNSAQGVSSLYANTTGYFNSAQGYASLQSNTTGNSNSAVGYQAGRYIADGATANATSNNSTYLGANTRALASGDTNETVIGYGAIGNGSNTITLGGTGTTGTIIPYGNVGIGTTPTAVLNLKAGSATAQTAPLKFTSGVNLTTPEAGAVEFDGTNLYFTPSTTRQTLATQSYITGLGYITSSALTPYALLSGASFTGSISATNLSGTNTGDQNLSGYAPLASPALTGTPTAPTQSANDNSTKLATTAYSDARNTQALTITNKRNQPRVSSATSTSTLTPDLSAYSVYYLTAQAAALTIANPIGTPVIGEVIAIYITDNGTSQTLTFGSEFKAYGAALPTATTISKTLMITAQFDGTNFATLTAQLQ